MSIQKKLVYALVLTILVFGVVLSLVSYSRSVSDIESQVAREEQKAESGIRTLLDLTDGIMSERVVSSMTLLKQRGMALGNARLGGSVVVNGTEARDLWLGGMSLANNFKLVDELTEVMGGTATIFSRQGDDFIRISTNVMKNGQRAIGTKLAPGGKAMAAIRQGKAYYGEVDILGKPYLTAYEPLVNSGGEVIGIWYVGYSADLTSLSNAVQELNILKQGFVALRDGKDVVRLHSDTVSIDAINAALNGTGNWQVSIKPYEKWGYDILLGTNTQETAALVQSAVIDGLITVLGMLVVIGVAIYLMIQNVVMQPLMRHIKTIRQLSQGEGDLTRRLRSGRSDEFGTMAKEFDRLLERLQQTMQNVGNESRKVREVSARLGGMSDSLSRTQTEQSDQIKNVASAASQLSSSAVEVTSTTASAQETTGTALQQVRDGESLLRSTCDRIQTQASSMEESEQAVEQLAAESANISTVLEVIQNIAEQTNLLALNAAIEAARAGEQGRGFAVVADEVRSLASRTQQSTEEINDMVAKLQKQGEHATRLMKTNREASSENAAMTQQVSDSFRQVVGAIESLTRANSEIANSTHEQGQVTAAMTSNIEAISSASDRNTGLVQQTRNACEELSNAVNSLESQIRQYKVE
ncbi:MAG: methyl-accepting chemotaxis protein [Oceanobacter sp.]